MPEGGPKSVVMVIDDMPEMGQTVRLWLEDSGYEVQVAIDAPEALALARSQMPDLAICDVILPSMLGWELCMKLKEIAAPRHLPVIILTAKATEYDEIRSYESKA